MNKTDFFLEEKKVGNHNNHTNSRLMDRDRKEAAAEQAFADGDYEQCITLCEEVIILRSCPHAMNSYIVRSLIRLGRIRDAFNSVKIAGSSFHWYSILRELERYFTTTKNSSLLHNVQDIFDLFQFRIQERSFRADFDLVNTFYGSFTVQYIEEDLILYRYHDDFNWRGAKCSFLTDKIYTTQNDIRNKLSIKPEWNALTHVTTLSISSPALVVRGCAQPSKEYSGFGTQYIIPTSVPIRRISTREF